ncbi:hypothetical protein EEJ42_09920 [Streptomyces botrytidirepellens]|uniref:Uncharacterized protein n=1 Tax=Streptomyces botrytidirepellens TaxID=2486417 RepID=A0A3M8WLS5_9ACTN|nr:hypothetical protein EEJ42_09920 [Streptomyces botrytidirepellens]
MERAAQDITVSELSPRLPGTDPRTETGRHRAARGRWAHGAGPDGATPGQARARLTSGESLSAG